MNIAIHGRMVLDMTGFFAAEDWTSMLRIEGLILARGVMDEHLANPQHDAEVTLETASCLTNPAIAIDAARSYAQTGWHTIYHC